MPLLNEVFSEQCDILLESASRRQLADIIKPIIDAMTANSEYRGEVNDLFSRLNDCEKEIQNFERKVKGDYGNPVSHFVPQWVDLKPMTNAQKISTIFFNVVALNNHLIKLKNRNGILSNEVGDATNAVKHMARQKYEAEKVRGLVVATINIGYAAYHINNIIGTGAIKQKQKPAFQVIAKNPSFHLYRIDNYEGSVYVCSGMNTGWCTVTGMNGEEFRSYQKQHGAQYVLWFPKTKRAVSIHSSGRGGMVTGHGNEYEFGSSSSNRRDYFMDDLIDGTGDMRTLQELVNVMDKTPGTGWALDLVRDLLRRRLPSGR